MFHVERPKTRRRTGESEHRVTASRDLALADPKIRGIFQVTKAVFERRFPHFEVRPVTTYRSPEDQKLEYAAKRSNCDGVTKLSPHNHQPSHAIDQGLFRKSDGAYLDDLAAKGQFDGEKLDLMYWVLGLMAQRNGARWGGDWDGDGIPVVNDPTEKLNDVDHIEIHVTQEEA